jgi:hypothetical protein
MDHLLVPATDHLLARATGTGRLLVPATGRRPAMARLGSTIAKAGTIGPADFEPGTDASPDGLCRTVSANLTGDIRFRRA